MVLTKRASHRGLTRATRYFRHNRAITRVIPAAAETDPAAREMARARAAPGV